LYLPLDLRATLDTVASHEELLADFATTPTLDRLVEGINQHFGASFLPGVFAAGDDREAATVPTHLLRDLLTEMSARIDGRPYRSPWTNLIAAPTVAPDGGYFLSHDRRLLFVVIDLADAPRTFAAEHAAILAIRGAIGTLRHEFPSVAAGVTGAPALFERLKGRERGAVEIALADYQAQLAADFAEQWRRVHLAARPAPLTLGDLPDEMRRRFIGKSGRLLLQIYSRHDPWDYPSQARFVEELATVDPDVTGQPVVGYESTLLIGSSFRLGLLYAFALVAGIAALMIRRLRETVLAMAPLILGTCGRSASCSWPGSSSISSMSGRCR